jgi:hypothetical protein
LDKAGKKLSEVEENEIITGEAFSIITKRNTVKRVVFESKRIRCSKQFTPLKNSEVVYLNKLPEVYAKVS